MTADDYQALRRELRAFVDERAWDPFHRPKDLALGVAVEAGELLEVFQWRDPAASELSPEDRRRLMEETADVAMYCMLLADKAGFDLLDAVRQKLARNRDKYPADKARGRSDKYDRL